MRKVTECEGKYTYDGKNYTLDFDNKGVKMFIDDDSGEGLICKDDLEVIAIVNTWEGQGFAFLEVADIKDVN